jgi:hypothetical protein
MKSRCGTVHERRVRVATADPKGGSFWQTAISRAQTGRPTAWRVPIIHTMRRIDLKVLTWATVAAAVASALWLAAVESDPVTARLTALPAALMSLVRPHEPGAGGAGRTRSPLPSQPRRQQ